MKQKRCPICKKQVEKKAPHWPFCSERCKIIDLGNWASGIYNIPDKPATDEEMEKEDSLKMEEGKKR